MTTYLGQDGVVKIGANSVAEVKSFSIEETGESVEDTAQGDTWRTFKPGLKAFSGTIEAQFDDTDATGQGVLPVGAEVTLILFPMGDDEGIKLTGNVVMTGRSITSELESIVTASYSFQGSGELVQEAYNA